MEQCDVSKLGHVTHNCLEMNYKDFADESIIEEFDLQQFQI